MKDKINKQIFPDKKNDLKPKENEDEFEECVSSLSDEQMEAVSQLVPVKEFKKGDIILREGAISFKTYFVIKGCVRQYYLVDGQEKTTFFYTEGHSIYASQGALKRLPAKHYLSCVEDCTLTVVTPAIETELYKRFPKFETMCRISLEEELSNYQEMLASYIMSSPEERYSKLLKTRPELLERVPQYQLASYLGVKPESLSRIRKRIMMK